MSLLDAYDPAVDGPWNAARAAHLLRHAGFAPFPGELKQALEEGPQATIARLIQGTEETTRFADLDRAGADLAAGGDIQRLAGWWLARLLHTGRPLHARLALFWHNHFATSNQKVASAPLMLAQLRTFERNARGNFRTMLREVARDPAMIVWLDGDQNKKGHPNENFARELFELFSLGPGNYSEHDIQETARAFSGWQQRRGAFYFNAVEHDDGPKTILGQTGNFDGDAVIDVALARPAAAKFLARKLAREFVADEPADALVGELAGALRAARFDLAVVMQRLLGSRAMLGGDCYRGRIKSPVEFVIGLARQFSMRAPGQALHEAVSQMGQRLFEPPTVKGWDGGRRWISSSTMLVRMNTATRAAAGDGNKGLDAGAIVAREKLADADAALRFACRLMLDGQLSPKLERALQQSCTGNAETALRTAVAAIAACPEYQLA